MGKNLVIVESPAKAKTIGRYLGKDYRITASVGHIKDLPSGTLAVDVKNNFKPIYVTMKGKEKVIKELKTYASESDKIYIATDPDREGEAIAWHIANVLKIDPNSSCRITFNEITKNAVQAAIKSPRSIDIDLANAQQARRILDRLVGYELSPFLWQKYKPNLSAGRVQSVATKIVMDRDSEIEKFVPEEYWLVDVLLVPENSSHSFKARYIGNLEGAKVNKIRLSNEEEAKSVVSSINGNNFVLRSVKKSQRDRNPYAPFTTSTLQQEASRRLGFSSKRTMSVAQQLYEGIDLDGIGQTALVSYIRTDSVRISDEAVKASRELIKNKYGEEYIYKSVRKFKNKNSAQDAHEAIRPTHFDLNPDSIKASLSSDQYKLYRLIWDRFLATQMAPARVETVTLEAECNNRIFGAKGETVLFNGYLAVYDDADDGDRNSDNEEAIKTKLPKVEEGMALLNKGVDSKQKFTTPPAHFTEATLIKTLEENGIGRPSTYAPTISTILDRNYVAKEGKSIVITEDGKIVTNLLADNFKEIVDVSFTADMEEKLDKIETGEKDWVAVLSDFYPEFHSQIEKATSSVEKVKIEPVKTGEVCPQCGGDLIFKQGKFGKFIGCSNYPNCSYTSNISLGVHCPLCGSEIVSRKSNKSKKTFYVCDKKGSNPNCEFISWDLPAEGKFCKTCGSYMVNKKFRGRSYLKCSNPDCESNKKKKGDKSE